MDKKKRLEELKVLIEKSNEAYYGENRSLFSDFEYDSLLKELENLEKELAIPEESAVSQKVGSSLKNTKFQKVEHKKAMLSLSNSYSVGDVLDFLERAKKNLSHSGELELEMEIKLDGLSISLVYEKGKLQRAVTRGDGVIGEDVTENVKQIAGYPQTLKEEIDIEVRGEIVLPLAEFEALNEKRLAEGEEVFANPRNAASGTLRQLDPQIVKERNLAVYFYFVVDAHQYGLKTQAESIQFLEKLAFPTTGICECFTKLEDLEKRISYWSEEREKLNYESDGLVIKVNDLSLWEELGSTGKSPRWAVAYKFPAKQASTKLLGITWQVGRTGKITPVAELQEVELSGSKVKRASLHNFDEIQRKDIRIGDQVFIEKAAEIIPQVVSAIKEQRTGEESPILAPLHCPSCSSLLVQEEDLVDLKCMNPNCPGKIQGEMEYFVSRDGMNITGLGGKILEKLLELNYITSIADIYDLHQKRDDLEKIEKFGAKSVENLLNSIEDSKKIPYEKLLYALGIPFVGKVAAKLLAKRTKSMEVLSKMSLEELQSIEGIGEKMALSIQGFFENPEKRKLLERLEHYGLQFQELDSSTKLEKQIFEGKSFLVTGTLANYKREELQEEIERLGGKNLSSVSKKLDYLVVGEKAGSKLEKARALGTVEILSEDDYLLLKERLTKE